MADKVKFLKGLQAEYDALATKDESTFYYTTDTGRLYIGNICLVSQVSNIQVAEGLSLANQNGEIVIGFDNDCCFLIDGGTAADIEYENNGETRIVKLISTEANDSGETAIVE